MTSFRRGELELAYEIVGDGPSDRTVVFLHGLLLSSEMMAPLAWAFAERFRVINFELHGHGKSSKPTDPASYSMEEFALDVVELIDHLGLEKVGLFGTSLGADVALETMLEAPGRVAGAVLEMPVLTHGAKIAARIFKPVARGLRSKRAPRALGVIARRMPAWPPGFPEAAALLADDPLSGAAVIEGLLKDAERSRWDDVARCTVPAMVIGHRLDPLHAYKDASHLAASLPNGRLVRATSVLELRLRPGRLLKQAMDFMEAAFGDAGSETARASTAEG